MRPHPDVAVVGGGVSGCYAAFRLAAHRRLGGGTGPGRVALFERDGRLGGKLASARIAGHAAEFGAMRFYRGAPLLDALLARLGLDHDVEDFPFLDDASTSYVGGRCAAGAEGAEWEAVDAAFPSFRRYREAYHARIREGAIGRARAVRERYRAMASGFTAGGRGLNDMAWVDFLGVHLDPATVRGVEAAGGYELARSAGSADSWLNTFFYAPPGQGLKALRGGFSELPRRLGAAIVADGGAVHLGCELRSVRRVGGGYRLAFEARGGARVVEAGAVILALPLGPLARVDLGALGAGPAAAGRRAVESVEAFKLFLVYASPWWARLGAGPGRTTTDLPLRQVVRFEDRGEGGLVLASYCNGPDTAYWVRRGARAAGRAAPFVEADVGSALVRDAHRQLCAVHGAAAAPPPLRAGYRLWTPEDDGGGWHVWRPGSDRARTVRRVRRPDPSGRLFIAGGAWSDEPGSVPGALLSAEAVVREGFGLPAPVWANAPLVAHRLEAFADG